MFQSHEKEGYRVKELNGIATARWIVIPPTKFSH
jgi:hypothetical protein